MADTHEAFYGLCTRCGGDLVPVTFKDEEEKITRDGWKYRTGRWRIAVSHLECPYCLKNYCVDDTFDGPWHEGGQK